MFTSLFALFFVVVEVVKPIIDLADFTVQCRAVNNGVVVLALLISC